MLLHKTTDQQLIQLLCTAFANNARMQVLIGKNRPNFATCLARIIAFSYFMVKKIKGIFVAKDRSTILLFYKKSEHYYTLQDALRYVHLAFFVIRLHRLLPIMKREKLIRQMRLKQIQTQGDQDYIYVWFFAQQKDYKGLSGMVEAKNFILEKAKTTQLPLYLETTDERLLQLYERIGFQFYDHWEDPVSDFKIWFGRCVALPEVPCTLNG